MKLCKSKKIKDKFFLFCRSFILLQLLDVFIWFCHHTWHLTVQRLYASQGLFIQVRNFAGFNLSMFKHLVPLSCFFSFDTHHCHPLSQVVLQSCFLLSFFIGLAVPSLIFELAYQLKVIFSP